MAAQFPVFALFLAISGMVSALLAVLAWRHRSIPIIRPFILLMAAETLWILGDALQMTGPGLSAIILINDIEYPGVMIVPIAWLFLVLVYTGRGHWLTRRTVPLFFIIPAIVWALILTNPVHYLYYTAFTPYTLDGTTIWLYQHGPLFWIHIAYCYLLSVAALVLAASRLFGPTRLYRKQTLILTAAACIPLLCNAAYVFRIAPFPQYDLTPLAFLAAGVLLTIGILRYQLFSAVPVTYSRVFSMMGDGVIVADSKNRVLDINPAAESIAGITSTGAIGKQVGQVIPELASPAGEIRPEAPSTFEIHREQGGVLSYFDVLVTPLDEKTGITGGYLYLLRDVTGRKTAELALGEANRKITLLTSITRHDVTNKIVALHTYLELVRDLATDPQQLDYLAKQEQAIVAINEQIAFTREYEQLGSEAPSWQDSTEVIRRATVMVEPGNTRIVDNTGGWEILADRMLFLVFYNLLDNAVKYGGEGLTAIRISAVTEGTVLVIAVEDDGAGIAPADKPHLFTRGFGRHTGLGLFLSREILAITGITIQEEGRDGCGARFVIRVPAGKYRHTTGSS